MYPIQYSHPGLCKLAFPVALTTLLATPLATRADAISDTHIFRLGVYEQDIDVKASATRQGLPEVELDFDRFLGLDESAKTYFVQYQWRFKERWTLSAFYTNMSADGEKTATTDFNWDGEEYKAGARLGSEIGIDTYLVTADYSFIRDEKKELGIGFGLHAFDIETTIEAEVAVSNPGEDEIARNRVIRNSSDLLAPLPNLRAFGRYMVTDKWAVIGSLGWLSANYDDWDGDYLFVAASTEYRFTEKFGVGVSYQISEIDVSNDNGKRKRSYDIDQYGPSIYLTYGF